MAEAALISVVADGGVLLLPLRVPWLGDSVVRRVLHDRPDLGLPTVVTASRVGRRAERWLAVRLHRSHGRVVGFVVSRWPPAPPHGPLLRVLLCRCPPISVSSSCAFPDDRWVGSLPASTRFGRHVTGLWAVAERGVRFGRWQSHVRRPGSRRLTPECLRRRPWSPSRCGSGAGQTVVRVARSPDRPRWRRCRRHLPEHGTWRRRIPRGRCVHWAVVWPAGWAALRFDYAATGDSVGTWSDPGLVARVARKRPVRHRLRPRPRGAPARRCRAPARRDAGRQPSSAEANPWTTWCCGIACTRARRSFASRRPSRPFGVRSPSSAGEQPGSAAPSGVTTTRGRSTRRAVFSAETAADLAPLEIPRDDRRLATRELVLTRQGRRSPGCVRTASPFPTSTRPKSTGRRHSSTRSS